MKKIIAIFFLCSFLKVVDAQNISAYIAYNDNLNIFDNGVFNKAELNKVKNVYVGYNYVAYKGFDGNFKMYWRNNVSIINEAAFIDKVMATNGLFAYQMGKQLKVIDNGKDKTLSNWCERSIATDSLVGYYDGNQNMYYVYYNGTTYALDDVLKYKSDVLNKDNAAIGKNMLLYVNSFQKLKVMYLGEFYELTDYTNNIKFDAGLNICVYSNANLTKWEAYCNGLVYDLEDIMPLSYKLGDGMVAYIDNVNNFKVFYHDKVIQLLTYAPANYEVTDSIIQFNDNVNNWYVFAGGEKTKLENYVPQSIKMSCSTLAYIDQLGALKVFQNGKVKTLTVERPTEYSVYGNVVQYTLGESDYKIYWKGTTY